MLSCNKQQDATLDSGISVSKASQMEQGSLRSGVEEFAVPAVSVQHGVSNAPAAPMLSCNKQQDATLDSGISVSMASQMEQGSLRSGVEEVAVPAVSAQHGVSNAAAAPMLSCNKQQDATLDS